MRIRKVEVAPLRVPFTAGGAGTGLMPEKWTHLDIALTRVETDDGRVGWGEGFAYGCRRATQAMIEDMVAPQIIGREIETADDVSRWNLETQQRLHLHGRYGVTMFAISAVDIALWDLVAKAREISLATLIAEGRALRAQLPAYASLVRYGAPELSGEYTKRAADEGYEVVKLHEIALPAIEAGRAAGGPDLTLITDVNCNWSLDQARALLPEMKRLGLYWVEEPVFPPDDAETLAGLQDEFDVRIASGENACTAVEFARTAGRIAFIQPSVIKVGGVSEFLRVCDLAVARGATVMPHAPYFGPGYHATAQIMAARPECALFEFLYVKPDRWPALNMPAPQAGQLRVPAEPGLGFEPDPEALRRYAA